MRAQVVAFHAWLLALLLSSAASAQPLAPPPYAPPSYAPPIYAPAPYPPPPFEIERPGRAGSPFRALPWRLIVELGGSAASGHAVPSVDGQTITSQERAASAENLQGVLDFRLGLQRLFGDWFGLGLQFGLANWQSGYLAKLHHPRSRYFSLAVVPEARIRLWRACRRCVSLVAGVRLGALLSVLGEYEHAGWGLAETQIGAGGLWGVQGGAEARLSERVSLRFMGGYEGALVQNRVDYGARGSEQMSFQINRGWMTLGLVVGLL
jgi:opacity protein-like surface antigen